MRLFRGIAVPSSCAKTTIQTILNTGLLGTEGAWRMKYSHPGALDELFLKANLSISDTRDTQPGHPAVCACGDFSGGAYYALRHNHRSQGTTPILIEFEASGTDLAVDGKDFLYKAFELKHPDPVRPVLRDAFGDPVLRYADLAWSSDCHSFRIALCDLAVYDPEVIKSHYSNQIVLGGRHGTVFRSAFLVKAPIPPSAFLNVQSLDISTTIPPPDVLLSDFWS